MTQCAVLRCAGDMTSVFVPPRADSHPHVEVGVCNDHWQQLADGADWAWGQGIDALSAGGGLLMGSDLAATGHLLVRGGSLTQLRAGRQDRDGHQVHLVLEVHRRGTDPSASEEITLVFDDRMIQQLTQLLGGLTGRD